MLQSVLSCATASILVLASCAAGAQSAASSSKIRPLAVSPAELKRQVEGALADTVSLYKWFHEHPELSLQEVETAGRLATELRASVWKCTKTWAVPAWSRS